MCTYMLYVKVNAYRRVMQMNNIRVYICNLYMYIYILQVKINGYRTRCVCVCSCVCVFVCKFVCVSMRALVSKHIYIYSYGIGKERYTCSTSRPLTLLSHDKSLPTPLFCFLRWNSQLGLRLNL